MLHAKFCVSSFYNSRQKDENGSNDSINEQEYTYFMVSPRLVLPMTIFIGYKRNQNETEPLLQQFVPFLNKLRSYDISVPKYKERALDVISFYLDPERASLENSS